MSKILGFALSFIPGAGPLLSSALGLVSSFGAKAAPIGDALAEDGEAAIKGVLQNAALREAILVGLLVFAFMHGRAVEAGLQAKLDACLHPKAPPIAAVQAAVSQAASVKHQAADDTLQEHGRKVAQEIPIHVTPEISRAYPLPVGAVRVLSDALAVPVPDAAGQPDDAASAVTLAVGVPNLSADLVDCRRNAQQLSDLQGWIRDQQAAAQAGAQVAAK